MKILRGGQWIELETAQKATREKRQKKAEQRSRDEKALRESHAEHLANGDLKMAAIDRSLARQCGIDL